MGDNEKPTKSPWKIKDFGYGRYEKNFDKLLIAVKLPSKMKAISFLLMHKNHFLQDLGTAYNMLFVVKVEGLKSSNIREAILNNLDWILKASENGLISLGKSFLAKFSGFVRAIFATYKQYKNEISGKLTEEEITYLASIRFVKNLKADERRTKELTSFCMTGVQWILPAIISGIAKRFIEIYDNQKSIVGDCYNECVDLWRECGLIEPVFTISVCPNPLCKHYEFLLSPNPRLQENCPQCGSSWVNIILNKVNEPFSSLKIEGKDLSIFLSGLIKSIVSLPVEAIPECYVKSGEEEVQVDVFLPSFPIVFECKVYKNPLITTYEELLSNYKNACSQLLSSMSKIGAKNGYIVTNLKVDEHQLSKLEEETKKIARDDIQIKLIAGTSYEKFVKKLMDELKKIDQQLTAMYKMPSK